MSHLVLHPGPRLVYHRWSSRGDQPGWVERDVTGAAVEYLHDIVQLADGVTLADVFALFEASPLLKQVHRRNFAHELCAEALKGVSPTFVPGYGPDAIEYLELYQVWGLYSREKRYAPLHRWDFHGIGYELRNGDESAGFSSGERVNWGVGTARLGELLPLPLRVNLTVPVCEEDLDSNRHGQELHTVTVGAPSLGQLLEGIVWELSFYGPPGSQADVAADEPEDADEAEASPGAEGDARGTLCSLEDLFSEWDSAAVARVFESIGPHRPGAVTLALRGVGDELPAAPALLALLGDDVVLRPEYAGLTAYELRKALRAADHQT